MTVIIAERASFFPPNSNLYFMRESTKATLAGLVGLAATKADESQKLCGGLRNSNRIICALVASICLSGAIDEANAVSLTITYPGCGSPATITWPSGVLEANSALGTGTWTPVGATSPYPLSPCTLGGANFYRLNLGGGNYSVNMVGYINVAVPHGFSLIANQLNNAPNNSILTLFPTATTPNFTTIYKFDNALGGYGSEQFSGGSWSSGGATVLNPGEGAFIFAPVAFTATFVGEVVTGTSTVNIPVGFSILSSVIPQQGNLYNPANGPAADLFFGVPQTTESVYQFNNTLGGFATYQFGTANWSCGCPGPFLNLGESFFNFNSAASGSSQWTRNFVVGP